MTGCGATAEVNVQEGLHESLITRTLDEEVNRALHLQAEIANVDEADQTHVLTRHIANAIGARLGNIRDPVKRLIAANEFLLQIEQQDLAVLDPVSELHALKSPAGPGVGTRYGQRPRTPLNDAALLTNAHGEPSLATSFAPNWTRRTLSISYVRLSCGVAFGSSSVSWLR